MSDSDAGGTDRDSCHRCGGDAPPENALPLSDYRALVGEELVLCDDCRADLVRWVRAGTDHSTDAET